MRNETLTLEEDESAFALVAELLFLLFLDEGCFSKASESLWEGMDWSMEEQHGSCVITLQNKLMSLVISTVPPCLPASLPPSQFCFETRYIPGWPQTCPVANPPASPERVLGL